MKGFRGNFSVVKRDWNRIGIVRTIVMSILVIATMAFSASIVLLVKALHLAKVFSSLHMAYSSPVIGERLLLCRFKRDGNIA